MPHSKTSDGIQLYYEDGRRAARPSCSCTSSAATTAAGSRRCATSRGATAASPSARAAIRRRTCRTTWSAIRKARAADDIAAVMDALGTGEARTSWACRWAASLRCTSAFAMPKRASSLVVAGAGYGAEKEHEDYFRDVSLEGRQAVRGPGLGRNSSQHLFAGARAASHFQNKDPRGWAEFATQLGEHSAIGLGHTMRGVQARRPSIYDLEEELQADERAHARGRRRRGRPLPAAGHLPQKTRCPACGLAGCCPRPATRSTWKSRPLFNALARRVPRAGRGQSQWKPRDPVRCPARS